MKTASVKEIQAQLERLPESEQVWAGNRNAQRQSRGSYRGGPQSRGYRARLAYSPRLQAIIAKSRRQIHEGDVLDHDTFWAEVKASRAVGRQPAREQPVQKINPDNLAVVRS